MHTPEAGVTTRNIFWILSMFLTPLLYLLLKRITVQACAHATKIRTTFSQIFVALLLPLVPYLVPLLVRPQALIDMRRTIPHEPIARFSDYLPLELCV